MLRYSRFTAETIAHLDPTKLGKTNKVSSEVGVCEEAHERSGQTAKHMPGQMVLCKRLTLSVSGACRHSVLSCWRVKRESRREQSTGRLFFCSGLDIAYLTCAIHSVP